MINLDYKCMEYAQKINETDEKKKELVNILRKALAVLQEDGVYAMFLWLGSKNQTKIREAIIELLNDGTIKRYLLEGSKENFSNGDSEEDVKKFYEELKNVAQDIDKLFFMKKLIERTMTYALYHAKAGDD